MVGTDVRTVRISKALYTQKCRDCSSEIQALAETIETVYRKAVDTKEDLRLFIPITTELHQIEIEQILRKHYPFKVYAKYVTIYNEYWT